ncbi:MAG: polyprenyl synthetase family protein [Halanaerobiaceae bacterium]
MNDIKQLINIHAEKINKILKELLEEEEIQLSETLVSSMRYSLLSGGKRLRPVLTTLVAEMINGDIENARRVGAAIEMIHTYSLIHDDLPSMDDDDYRRGKKTNHRVYGPGIAILAGDGLLTYSFSVLSKLSLPAEKKIKIIELISQCAGLQGMVGGQVLDLEGEEREIDLQEMQIIHRAKTGALFKASILAGAYCGDISAREIDALEKYAELLGLTFQIVDDILDVIGDEEKMGKQVGSDDKLNKSTYPKLLGLEESQKKARENAIAAKNSLDIFGEKSYYLKKIIDFVVERQT